MKLLIIAPRRHELPPAARAAGHDVVHATGATSGACIAAEVTPDLILVVHFLDVGVIRRLTRALGIPVSLVVAAKDLGDALADFEVSRLPS